MCIKLKYNVTEIKLIVPIITDIPIPCPHDYSTMKKKEWSSLEQFIVVDANEPQRPYQQDLNEKVNRSAQGMDSIPMFRGPMYFIMKHQHRLIVLSILFCWRNLPLIMFRLMNVINKHIQSCYVSWDKYSFKKNCQDHQTYVKCDSSAV